MFNVMVDAKAQSTKLCSMEMGQEVKKKNNPTSPFPPSAFSLLPSSLSIDHVEETLTNSFFLPKSASFRNTLLTFADEAMDKCSVSVKSISEACADMRASHLEEVLG